MYSGHIMVTLDFALVITFTLLCVTSVMPQSDLDYDGTLHVKMLHSFDSGAKPAFKERGAVTIQSIRTGATLLQQSALSQDDKRELQTLADEDGYYRIKALLRSTDGKEISLLTFVKACSLVESSLCDAITISLDHIGTPIAISMTTCVGVCEGHILGDVQHFNTSVHLKHMELAPVPDTATYIMKLEKEKEARERGETKDNRSFLGKYWMYLVPVMIFVMLSGAATAEGPSSGGGR